MSHMNLKDVRIEGKRDDSMQWHGHCRAVHLPTGLLVEWDWPWNDGGAPERAALVRLEEMTQPSQSWRYAAPQ